MGENANEAYPIGKRLAVISIVTRRLRKHPDPAVRAAAATIDAIVEGASNRC